MVISICVALFAMAGCPSTQADTISSIPSSSSSTSSEISSNISSYTSSSVAGDTSSMSSDTSSSMTKDSSETFLLSTKLNIDAKSIKSFKYEKVSALEENKLTLTGEDAIKTTESLLKVSMQNPNQKNPTTGRAMRYTIELADGNTTVIYNNSMLSIDDKGTSAGVRKS